MSYDSAKCAFTASSSRRAVAARPSRPSVVGFDISPIGTLGAAIFVFASIVIVRGTRPVARGETSGFGADLVAAGDPGALVGAAAEAQRQNAA